MQPSGLQVFRGAQEVIEVAIELITSAGTIKQPGEVLLTFQVAPEAFDNAPALRQELWSAIRTASEQGWKVTHLLRISEDPTKVLTLVGDIIDYMSAESNYIPYYFRQYGTLSAPYDILVVAGKGAMMLLATEQPDYVDTAVYSTDPLFTQALIGHFQQLFAPDKISPLMKMYTREMFTSYEVITNFELEPGGRFLIQPYLSALTRPKSLFSKDGKWEQALKARGLDSAKMIEFFRQRVKTFEDQLKEYQFRDICSRRALLDLRDNGAYERQGLFKEEPNERIDHLQAVIHLLEQPNYELAMLDESEEHFLPLATFVAKPHAVLLDTSSVVKGNPYAQIEIREPRVVQGFSAYFTYIWNQIKEENRDKDKIRKWLQDQITYLGEHQENQGLNRN
jgi:hypothetical protein